MTEFGLAWKLTAASEGGYSDDPDDQGNYYNNTLIGSKFGITGNYYFKATGQTIGISKMQSLTESEAGTVAKSGTWDKYALNRIPIQYLANQIFDILFHFSFTTASRIIQLAVLQSGQPLPEFGQDNVFGSETLKAVIQLCTDGKADLLNNAIVAQRNLYYQSRVIENPVSEKWLGGWLSRADKYLVTTTSLSIGLLIAAAVTVYILYKK